ncbi:dTDP-4-dehydrorhamnose reductase [Salana multivorans]|uniref:dTDP-4-dehydrorhamnose reductase n=1 Tax=Salana multivorans TaxID=120377 RepID=UPI0024901F7D|nr:dTDP-4-dehydrorhamnose reductase [Salana multivorans]
MKERSQVRVLVTGAEGMLGKDLCQRFASEHDVRATDRGEVDITDPSQVDLAVRDVDVVVNCAAWTNVDAAEEREPEAFLLNAVAPQLLARAATSAGARLVQISTDYVFSGTADSPYAEDDPARPRSAYGRTKAAGEWAVRAAGAEHLVVRTAWLYGAGGGSFPRTIGRAASERDHLDVVDDQVGQPTWTVDVADLVARLVESDAPGGCYHATSSGETTWFTFAQAVVAAQGLEPAMVRPTTSDAFVRPAPRPAYSVLGHDRLHDIGVTPIGPWRERWEIAAPAILA